LAFLCLFSFQVWFHEGDWLDDPIEEVASKGINSLTDMGNGYNIGATGNEGGDCLIAG